MTKKEVLNKYKSAIISALNLVMDNISNIEDLLDKEKICSKDRYTFIKNKIENEEELTQGEYSLLSMICLYSSDNLAQVAQKYLKSAEEMKNLSKIFIA